MKKPVKPIKPNKLTSPPNDYVVDLYSLVRKNGNIALFKDGEEYYLNEYGDAEYYDVEFLEFPIEISILNDAVASLLKSKDFSVGVERNEYGDSIKILHKRKLDKDIYEKLCDDFMNADKIYQEKLACYKREMEIYEKEARKSKIKKLEIELKKLNEPQ